MISPKTIELMFSEERGGPQSLGARRFRARVREAIADMIVKAVVRKISAQIVSDFVNGTGNGQKPQGILIAEAGGGRG